MTMVIQNMTSCRYSPCLDLCTAHALDRVQSLIQAVLAKVEKVAKDNITRVADAPVKGELEEKPKEVMKGHALYVKHQADYHKFLLSSLQSGDVVVIVNYKMKLELASIYLNVILVWKERRISPWSTSHKLC